MDDSGRKLIDELEKRLVWYREEASDEEFDAEEVDAICTILEKLSPIMPRRTKEEAYQSIMRRLRLEEEEEDGGRKVDVGGSACSGKAAVRSSAGSGKAAVRSNADSGKTAAGGSTDDGKTAVGSSGACMEVSSGNGKAPRFKLWEGKFRAAIVFVVVAGILLSLNMVTYAREDKSLFTVILEKVGILKVVRDETADTSALGFGETGKEFYDSWAELDREVKEKLVVPEYVPAGYALFGIRYWNHDNQENIQANYYDQGGGHLLIEIVIWEGDADRYRETLMDETVCTLLSEYSDRDTLYYAYEDEYVCIAFMGNSSYRIMGNIPLEEMRKIGEGLRRGEKNKHREVTF